MSALEFKYNEALCELESLKEKVTQMDGMQSKLDALQTQVAERDSELKTRDSQILDLKSTLEREHAASVTTNSETERWKTMYHTAQTELEQE